MLRYLIAMFLVWISKLAHDQVQYEKRSSSSFLWYFQQGSSWLQLTSIPFSFACRKSQGKISLRGATSDIKNYFLFWNLNWDLISNTIKTRHTHKQTISVHLENNLKINQIKKGLTSFSMLHRLYIKKEKRKQGTKGNSQRKKKKKILYSFRFQVSGCSYLEPTSGRCRYTVQEHSCRGWRGGH